jgi:hypothetical protein
MSWALRRASTTRLSGGGANDQMPARGALDPALEAPPALAPLIDPEPHSCGTVPLHGAAGLAHPEPGFWIVGAKPCGRAPPDATAPGAGSSRNWAVPPGYRSGYPRGRAAR